MLEVGWIFEECTDGRIRTCGDLMGIFNEASSEFIDTKLVRTFIANFWDSYYIAIIKYRIFPAVLYLITMLVYFTFFLFDSGNFPNGVKAKDRWEISGESIVRWVCDALLFYHLAYEFFQVLRFGRSYWLDTGNYLDLGSLFLNGFIL